MYTPPTGTKALVRIISLVNTDGSVTTNIFLRLGLLAGDVNVLGTVNDKIPEGNKLLNKDQGYLYNIWPLNESETLKMWAADADIVDYVILGSEEAAT